jgi:hypothetical protein
MVCGHCIFDMSIIRGQHSRSSKSDIPNRFQSGRPTTAVTPEDRNRIYALIKHDYHIKTWVVWGNVYWKISSHKHHVGTWIVLRQVHGWSQRKKPCTPEVHTYRTLQVLYSWKWVFSGISHHRLWEITIMLKNQVTAYCVYEVALSQISLLWVSYGICVLPQKQCPVDIMKSVLQLLGLNETEIQLILTKTDWILWQITTP